MDACVGIVMLAVDVPGVTCAALRPGVWMKAGTAANSAAVTMTNGFVIIVRSVPSRGGTYPTTLLPMRLPAIAVL